MQSFCYQFPPPQGTHALVEVVELDGVLHCELTHTLMQPSVCVGGIQHTTLKFHKIFQALTRLHNIRLSQSSVYFLRCDWNTSNHV